MLGRIATKKFAIIMGVVVTFCLVVALSVCLLYKPLPSQILEVVSNDTSVSEAEEFYTGTVLSATTGGSVIKNDNKYAASADSGYLFAYWTVNGVKYSGDKSFKSETEPTPVFVNTITEVTDQSTLQSALNSATSTTMIVLKNDITVNSSFAPVATFAGILDGAGFSINGLSVTAVNNNNCGAICGTLTGVIKNLTIRGSVTASTTYVGAFAGTINGGLLSRCVNNASVTNNSTSETTYAGGMVANSTGSTASTIYHCKNFGTVKGKCVGAIIYVNVASTRLVSNQNCAGLYAS